jgi:hypothetical protein
MRADPALALHQVAEAHTEITHTATLSGVFHGCFGAVPAGFHEARGTNESANTSCC